MSNSLDDILNEDDLKSAADDLHRLVELGVDRIDALILLWVTDEGVVFNRLYGSPDEVVGLLERSKHVYMHQVETSSDGEVVTD